MIGYMAYSKAGHDRNKKYLIIGETKNHVMVVDGITKDFQNPKRKNKKHIQVIKKYENLAITEMLLKGEQIENEKVIQEVEHVKSRCN